MKKLFVALLVLPLAQGVAAAQPMGDAARGKALWEGNTTACRNCHGQEGQGAFGPDLAGRGLNFEQFRTAVRRPWGIMPAFIESQISDQGIADLTAYFASLPKPAQPGPWRFPVPPNAHPGQATALNLGCGQCHGPDMNGPRTNLGAVNADFDYFARLVYEHTTAMPEHRRLLGNNNPTLNMGNFNRARVHEEALEEIYDWMRNEIGFRVPLQGQISAGQPSANGVTYTVNVRNNGVMNRGLSAEGVLVRLSIPAGTQVVNATGPGYQGVKMQGDDTIAEWIIPSVAAQEQRSLTITLSKAATAQNNLRGEIRWNRPGPRVGQSADVVNIAPPQA